MLLLYSIDFPTNWTRDAGFHRITSDYSRADWDGLRDVVLEDIFKLRISAAASEFCGWHQVGIEIESINSTLTYLHGFLAAHAAAIVHINHIFRLY